MNDIRYGIYLRPSFVMCRAQAEIHDLLERQYGLRVAGRFMPHATIKGFFTSDASPDAIVTALDPVLAAQRSFTVYNRGVIPLGGSSLVLDIHHTPTGARNEPVQAFHEAILDAVEPFVSRRCNFTPSEYVRDRFFAHLTLAMADIPLAHFDEIFAFVREAEPVGPASFPADVIQLWRFQSQDWTGAWWETLEWKLLHSWRLRLAGR